MLRLPPAVVRIALSLVIGTYLRLWPEDGFAFAGLSLRTSLKAAQQRYRHSSVVGAHVYL
jgi:hypothetical protein